MILNDGYEILDKINPEKETYVISIIKEDCRIDYEIPLKKWNTMNLEDRMSRLKMIIAIL